MTAPPPGSREAAQALDECERCQGEAWVCESHPEMPWREGQDLKGCICDAGIPCPDCNPCDQHNPPRMPPGFKDWKDVN